MRTISSNTEGLLRTVNDILDLASLAAGKVEFEQSEFDLYEVVEGAIDVAAERGQSKDLELVLTMGPDLPRHLIGDRHRVAQALATLVDSSIKFNDHGEVVVSVDCEAARRRTSRPCVSSCVAPVRERQPNCRRGSFSPFWPPTARTDRKLGGSGLSLAIAAQLVERMGGGTITVGWRTRP